MTSTLLVRPKKSGRLEAHQAGIQTGDPEPINRYLACEHIVTEATIPVGSNPPHGDIPKPPPKPKPLPTNGDEVDYAKLAQATEASEKAGRNIDYQRTDHPSTKRTKVKVMIDDMNSYFE